MRHILLLFFSLAWAGMAADRTYTVVELTGPWKIKPGDDSRWARADFDDRDWADFRLPRQELPPVGYSWLRRRVELPEATDRTNLVLALGAVAAQYELYANGKLIPGGPPMMPARNGYFPRARAFAITPVAIPSQGPVTIALRIYHRPSGSPMRNLASVIDRGPYWIADSGRVPANIGMADVEYQLRVHTPAALIGALSWVAGLLTLVLWFGERKRLESLSLAALMLLSNYDLLEYLCVLNDWPTAQVGFFISASCAALVYLAMSLCRSFPIWLQALVAVQMIHSTLVSFIGINSWLTLNGIVPPQASFGLSTVTAWVALGWLTIHVARTWRQEPWRRRGLFLAVAVLFLSATSLTNFELFLFGYYWNKFGIAALVISLTILVLMLLDLAADRREKQRLATEVEAARYVQRLLLGAPQSPAPAFITEAVYEPAQEVGGDFHWSRAADDGSLIVTVGDVSGKGLKAAMLVGVAIGILRNEKSDSPAAILTALNNGLTGHTGGGFVTCCCARFTPDGTVTIANAGHLAPYRDGREVEVPTGLPLGVNEGVAYEEAKLTGKLWTFLSDGVVEAANQLGDLFGFERTQALAGKPACTIAEAAKAWGQNDDITVVTVRRAVA